MRLSDPDLRKVCRVAHDKLSQLEWTQGFNFGVDEYDENGQVEFDHPHDIPEGRRIVCCCLEGALLLAADELEYEDDVLQTLGEAIFDRELLTP